MSTINNIVDFDGDVVTSMREMLLRYFLLVDYDVDVVKLLFTSKK